MYEDEEDDYGYQRGRCPCGRSTWSDTSVFDCGCGAGVALADEMDAQEIEAPEFPEPPAEDEPADYILRVNGEAQPLGHISPRSAPIAEPLRTHPNLGRAPLPLAGAHVP